MKHTAYFYGNRLKLMRHYFKFFLFVFLIASIPEKGSCCINSDDEFLDIARNQSEQFFPVPKGMDFESDKEEFDTKLLRRKDLSRSNRKEDNVSYAVLLILKGDYEEAEKILEKCSRRWPMDYNVASNYGTVLELNGNPAKALAWIQRSLHITPNSHNGSEWIHVEILKAKSKKQLPSGETLTKTEFGKAAAPECQLPDSVLRKLQNDLFYQLNERLSFIEPEDHFISELAWVLANVSFCRGDFESSAATFDIAKEYGYGNLTLLESRKSEAARMQTDKETGSAEMVEDTVAREEVEAKPLEEVPPTNDQKIEGDGPNWLSIAVAVLALIVMTGAVVKLLGSSAKP